MPPGLLLGRFPCPTHFTCAIPWNVIYITYLRATKMRHCTMAVEDAGAMFTRVTLAS